MKHHKLTFLLILVFGLCTAGIEDLLLQKQGVVLCSDKDSKKNADEPPKSKKIPIFHESIF